MFYGTTEIARQRVEELHREAARFRLARSVAAERRWRALAHWADRRAESAARRRAMIQQYSH